MYFVRIINISKIFRYRFMLKVKINEYEREYISFALAICCLNTALRQSPIGKPHPPYNTLHEWNTATFATPLTVLLCQSHFQCAAVAGQIVGVPLVQNTTVIEQNCINTINQTNISASVWVRSTRIRRGNDRDLGPRIALRSTKSECEKTTLIGVCLCLRVCITAAILNRLRDDFQQFLLYVEKCVRFGEFH